MLKSTVLLMSTALLVLTSLPAVGQSVTGFQPFGTFNNTGTETIAPAPLNIHWEFPVVQKAGRIPFNFSVAFDSSPSCSPNGYGLTTCGVNMQLPGWSIFGG